MWRVAALVVLAGCGGDAACDDYVDAVDGCLDAIEAASGVDLADARPDPTTCPGDEAASVWACRADAYAASPCDTPNALADVAVALGACAEAAP